MPCQRGELARHRGVSQGEESLHARGEVVAPIVHEAHA